MFDACLPLGPVVMSKVTRCASRNDLKPLLLIAEKCANKSSPPLSGVMKPKPLASLNHFTVPVAISISLIISNLLTTMLIHSGHRISRKKGQP